MSLGEYVSNIGWALDRLLAAILGWSGKCTVSAECGLSNCVVCKLVKLLLGIDHCVDAARDEGLIKKE